MFGSPSQAPLVFSVSPTSTRAVALEAVSMRTEPFSLNSEANFNPADSRTRIVVFGTNFELLQGEGANAFTAEAQDGSGTIYTLKVEYVGSVPNFEGIYMLVLRLNDAMPPNVGDVLIRINLHGMTSNRVRVAIGQIGGGPADDAPGVGTPAPATAPGAALPLTIDQYRAQFSNPAMASGSDALRFLDQVSWGPNDSDLTHLRQIGMQAYLNEQFTTPPLFSDVQSNYPRKILYPIISPGAQCPDCFDAYNLDNLQKQFATNALTRPDQLRQRVAFALHKLIVVAGRDLNNNESSWYAPYLQILDRDAFGNYRQLLLDITLNPGMGTYLNMAGNSRVAPNENYARELMQLFSIGVDKLNLDGTPVVDANGNRVPTYGQNEISNLARVFTGWVIGVTNINTFNGQTVPDYLSPMVLTNNVGANGPADTDAKTLLNGLQLPACSNCAGNASNLIAYKNAELNSAIDNLFNHQNTAPYVCTQLVHQLVTSNPSPAYVGRCAAAFANNGSGVRGDMKAIITAILLDPEARGDQKTDPNYGRLRDPVQYILGLLRTFNANSDGALFNAVSGNMACGLTFLSPFSTCMGQELFNPPTVFSYYPADYILPGTILTAPEFGLMDTVFAYPRVNFVNTLFLANNGNGLPALSPGRLSPTGTQVNYAAYQAQAGTPGNLINMLDTSMLHGSMSIGMRNSIIDAITAIDSSDLSGRTRTAIYLVATSSQYQVQR
ncbi:MAG TPA: DUF1800 family protein [Pyrinomonadaceae bacterium]|nr:DUF1800 family protein [Pyrinomonadaceae bacterium]